MAQKSDVVMRAIFRKDTATLKALGRAGGIRSAQIRRQNSILSEYYSKQFIDDAKRHEQTLLVGVPEEDR